MVDSEEAHRGTCRYDTRYHSESNVRNYHNVTSSSCFQAHEDSIPHPPPSFVHDQRRRNRRLPNFRRLSIHNLRRLSLPNPVPDLSGAFGPRRGRLMRRNTEGLHTSPPDPTTSASAGPASGGWRHFTNPFKVPKVSRQCYIIIVENLLIFVLEAHFEHATSRG